jgi:hypothetical protein
VPEVDQIGTEASDHDLAGPDLVEGQGEAARVALEGQHALGGRVEDRVHRRAAACADLPAEREGVAVEDLPRVQRLGHRDRPVEALGAGRETDLPPGGRLRLRRPLVGVLPESPRPCVAVGDDVLGVAEHRHGDRRTGEVEDPLLRCGAEAGAVPRDVEEHVAGDPGPVVDVVAEGDDSRPPLPHGRGDPVTVRAAQVEADRREGSQLVGQGDGEGVTCPCSVRHSPGDVKPDGLPRPEGGRGEGRRGDGGRQLDGDGRGGGEDRRGEAQAREAEDRRASHGRAGSAVVGPVRPEGSGHACSFQGGG